MIGKGNPEGCVKNAKNAAWYNNQVDQDVESIYKGPARQCPGYELVWKPALDLAKGRILDLGCGQGHLAELVRSDCRGLEYALGVDFSSRSVTLARIRNPHDSFEEHGLMHGELPECDYDTAMALEVLEHVADDMALLERIPKGKRVVLSVPSFYTEGHVRWFGTVGQAIRRYIGVMQIADVVVTSQKAVPEGNFWVIMSGVKK